MEARIAVPQRTPVRGIEQYAIVLRGRAVACTKR